MTKTETPVLPLFRQDWIHLAQRRINSAAVEAERGRMDANFVEPGDTSWMVQQARSIRLMREAQTFFEMSEDAPCEKVYQQRLVETEG